MKAETLKPHLFEVKRQGKYWWVVDISLLVEKNERVEYAICSANRCLQVGDVFWAILKQMETGLYLEHTGVARLETCFNLPDYVKK